MPYKDKQQRKEYNAKNLILWRKKNRKHCNEWARNYHKKNKDKINALNKLRYKKNPQKYRNYQKEYRKNNYEKCCERCNKYKKQHSKEIKKYATYYRQTEKGKKVHRKTECERRRKLLWIQMFENPFNEDVKVDYHHITDTYVVAIPRDLHRLCYGKFHRERTMEIVKQIYPGVNNG